jgi:hypothetical protein
VFPGAALPPRWECIVLVGSRESVKNPKANSVSQDLCYHIDLAGNGDGALRVIVGLFQRLTKSTKILLSFNLADNVCQLGAAWLFGSP